MDLKFVKSGEMAIAKFNVAVARMKKDDAPYYFNCVAFGKTGEIIADCLHKGSPILINGHMQSGKYDKDGHTVYTMDLVVDRFEFAGGKKEDNIPNKKQDADLGNDEATLTDLDIPFK